MKKFNIALERGKRYFENDEIKEFYFVALEFIFNKSEINSGRYAIQLKSSNDIVFSQVFQINIFKKNIVFENYHEDPLIESETHYFICAQLDEKNLQCFRNKSVLSCDFYYEDILLRTELIKSKDIDSILETENWFSKIDCYDAVSIKNSIVRLHLGKKDGSYHEDEFFLKAHSTYNFKKMLDGYEYFALQFSYEGVFDLEEKHVLKGFKGITNSSYYLKDDFLIYPLFPFSKKYTNIYSNGWVKLDSIDELIKFYNKNKSKKNIFFEMNDVFVMEFYKKFKTSCFGQLYSINDSKIYHIDSDLCQDCEVKSYCMQLVPSGLSESLFKKNLLVENCKNCVMYKIVNELKG